MLKEVRFRYQHQGCWLQDTTVDFPEITLVSTSLYLSGDDVVVGLTAHAADATIIEQAFRTWQENPRIRKITKIHEGPRGTRFHAAYDKTGSIYPHIIEHTPVSIGSIRFSGGEEFYTILGEGPDVSAILREMSQHGGLEVQSIRDVDDPEDPAAPTALDLTDKQLDALVTAYKAGYYQWPRKQTATQLAKGLGLSSSAFLDHLRTAEARLMDAQVASLIAQERPAPPRRQPKDAPANL